MSFLLVITSQSGLQAAETSKKTQRAVLESSSEEEEQDEGASSADYRGSAEIERVLHGRPSAEPKQEEFLVKFKGNTCCVLSMA